MSVFAVPCSRETTKGEFAIESRSTSAGSRDRGEVYRQGSGRVLSSLNSSLPEYEYPVPVVVRNTFIDTQTPRNLSLDEFFEERRIQSCVSCPVPSPDDDDHDGDDLKDDECEGPREPEPLGHTITSGAQRFMTTVATAAGYWTALECAVPVAPPVNSSAAQPMARILMLSEALPEPSLGSPEMPTIGSAGHNIGTCKPCAFFHTKGCGNGVQCFFCHLCAPEEKRKRQKDKVTMLREMRQQGRRQVRL